MEALEGSGRFDDPDALPKAATLLQEAAGAAEDAVDALESLVEYAGAREAEHRP